MAAAETLRLARNRAGLSLRELAARAGTSHSTLSAYESGTQVPSVATFVRVVRAAGFALDFELRRRIDDGDRAARGRELEEVVELAGQFPVRHNDRLAYPVFGAN